MSGYIYIRDNEWFKLRNVYKLGITHSIKDRSNSYITSEIIRGCFIVIVEVDLTNNSLSSIDNLMKKEFKELNIYFDGGTEYYNRIVIDKIEDFLIKFNINYNYKNENELKRINRENEPSIIIKQEQKLELRDYQETAINVIVNELQLTNKIYLDLSTGGGKSTIAYITMTKIKPDIILIFSPRTTIKKQNINEKYLNLLKKCNHNPLIINECIQSYNKVYNKIIENNYENIFIWFDEAHWALDDWIIDFDDKIKQFFLNDNNKIKFRLFTSASPNKNFVNEHKNIYGLLYQPIKPKELIKNGYLAKLEVDIFDTEITKEEINYNSLIINTFYKYNRKQGLSFHNTCINAYNYYLWHLNEYKNKRTDIKPYLFANNDFIKTKTIKIEFDNIEEFEKEPKTIGYCVDRISMGYDNNKIDIIYFTDCKSSSKDIIQSIGRGLRPLKYDNEEFKYLRLIIPTNINNDICDKYKKIKEVLKYLLLDLELSFDDIKSYEYTNLSINPANNHKNPIIIEKNNIDIDTMKYEIINKKNEWNTNKIINQLKLNNIHNPIDYEYYKKNNMELNLPDLNLLLEFPEFKFIDTYFKNKCPFYNKEECIEVIEYYQEEFIINDLYDDEEKITYLIETKEITKLPKMPFWYFYGGKRNEYFID